MKNDKEQEFYYKKDDKLNFTLNKDDINNLTKDIIKEYHDKDKQVDKITSSFDGKQLQNLYGNKLKANIFLKFLENIKEQNYENIKTENPISESKFYKDKNQYGKNKIIELLGGIDNLLNLNKLSIKEIKEIVTKEIDFIQEKINEKEIKLKIRAANDMPAAENTAKTQTLQMETVQMTCPLPKTQTLLQMKTLQTVQTVQTQTLQTVQTVQTQTLLLTVVVMVKALKIMNKA